MTLIVCSPRRPAVGQLRFHNLLVRSLQHGPAVPARLHARYQQLLLDEFRDTDPIQIELAVRIAAAQPAAVAEQSARIVGVHNLSFRR